MVLILLATCSVAYADDAGRYTLNISDLIDGNAAVGTKLSLYQVADSESNWLEPSYMDWRLDLQADNADFVHLAKTLSVYILNDGFEADAVAVVDETGQAQFIDLQPGFYLLTGGQYVDTDCIYDTVPILVCLRSDDYEFNIAVKHEVRSLVDNESETVETISRRVLQVWDDDIAFRPDFIIMNLLEDGVVIDSVELSDANQWGYTWDNLDVSADYYVRPEAISEDYNISVEQQGITFVVTNTLADVTMTSERPPAVELSSVGSNVIIRTGQSWLPSFNFLVLGLALVLFGFVLNLVFKRLRVQKKSTVADCAASIGYFFMVCSVMALFFNICDDTSAKRVSTMAIKDIRQSAASYRDFVNSCDMPVFSDCELGNVDMKTLLSDGRSYIGVLDMPSVGLQCAVQSECDYDNLKFSPCLYSGSVYDDKCVIAGHNYLSSFGRLKKLNLDDCVLFTDIEGYEFCYQVKEISTILETDVETFESKDWDLLLFTCTLDAKSRVLIGCERVYD